MLEQAQRARVRVAAWRVAAGVVGGFGALSLMVTLLTLAFFSPGVLGTALLLMTVSIPLLLAAIAWNRAQRYVRERDDAIDQAWLAAAGDVMQRTEHELDARGLAKTLRIDEAQAEQLLARLDVENVVRARVSADGELLYSPRAGHKLRVPEQTAEPEAASEDESPAQEPKALARKTNDESS